MWISNFKRFFAEGCREKPPHRTKGPTDVWARDGICKLHMVVTVLQIRKIFGTTAALSQRIVSEPERVPVVVPSLAQTSVALSSCSVRRFFSTSLSKKPFKS